MKTDSATSRQIAAADPTVSTWLSANAGSGKTRVLTDRVARLLLEGAPPQNIMCLTYTKAAATEMQNRLLLRLGEWSMMADVALSTELEKLGIHLQAGSKKLAYARTLFARAIDTPGGLRIQTIHSFCAALLRRFPLEAGVSPMFREMEERAVNRLREEVVEDMANSKDVGTVTKLAKHYSGDDFSALTAGAVRHQDTLRKGCSESQIWHDFHLPNGFSESDILSRVFLGGEAALMTKLIPILRNSAKPSDLNVAKILEGIDFAEPDIRHLAELFSLFLFGGSVTKSVPFSAKISSIPTKGLLAENDDIKTQLNELMIRVEECRQPFLQLFAARKTKAFYDFAARFLPRYEAEKSARGWLDFDDLILRARGLLSDPAVSQWVLFRLDGGLDHILVDEAQDTSPDQWKVIELLAQEFGVGIGARPDATRTVFVVGDLKQSIYSFQGADPKAFDKMRHHFAANLAASQQKLVEHSLEHSFRSSPAILNLVDHVFGDSSATDNARHVAFHQDMPGRVDLWNIVEKSPEPEEKEWYDPSMEAAVCNHIVALADKIAAEIKNLVDTQSISGKNGDFCPVEYGDFLVLVQRRSALFHQIIRACKSLDLPVAGADRLKIGAEIAVKDLRSLMAFLALPMDSLSLAAALRSPLFGMEESALFDLAQGRKEKDLWSALVRRQAEFEEIHKTLSELRNQVDFLGPYELLERILTRHGGRERLLARLGPEAEDGIDALLAQAIAFEASETPSLTGFLVWMDADGVEIKRRSDSASGRIRVMTTHGAKGLESPIVILPDTCDRGNAPLDEIIPADDQKLMWRPIAALQPDVMISAVAKVKSAQSEEMSRLLYVALTRAEKWLIVCAAGTAKPEGNSWYRSVERGLRAAKADEYDSPTGPGFRLETGRWEQSETNKEENDPDLVQEIPAWALTPASAPEANSLPAQASNLGGDKTLPGGLINPNAAAHGSLLHKLLEHLPKHPEVDWTNLAGQLMSDPVHGVDTVDRSVVFSEAVSLIKNPEFSHIFATNTLAEIDVSAKIEGIAQPRMRGIIDRLVVTPEKVLVVDFKSNQQVPTSASDTPKGILRQMAAYLLAVCQIYPDRDIDLSILWTQTATLMPLPHDIVMDSLK